MLNEKRILVAPLDWGLGHASRCIPVIQKLLDEDKEIIIAADGQPLNLLREEFPNLQYIRLKGISIRYPKRLPFPIYFGLKLPQILQSIKTEQKAVRKIVAEYKIDAIISDNRYGLHLAGVKSILITHQLFVKSPYFEKQIHRIIHKQIKCFDECWVPDFEGEDNLSGELSHGKLKPENVKYIGPLSRFKPSEIKVVNYGRRLLVILSGPEPNRTHFERKVIKQLLELNVLALVIRGVVKPDSKREKLSDKVEVISHLNSRKMLEEIQKSELVLCRSGYSSIMDMYSLGKKAIIIPTEGQTEQEYLADYLSSREKFHTANENSLDIESILNHTNLLESLF